VDPLIKSQLLYQLSYAPTVRLDAARIYHPGPALSIRASVKLTRQANPPLRLMYMSRCSQQLIIRPKPTSTVSIAVPP
jgi:hypothetical protein